MSDTKNGIDEKPSEILELESFYGITLERSAHGYRKKNNFYELNDSGFIVGLSIESANLKDIFPISQLISLEVLNLSDNNLEEILNFGSKNCL